MSIHAALKNTFSPRNATLMGALLLPAAFGAQARAQEDAQIAPTVVSDSASLPDAPGFLTAAPTGGAMSFDPRKPYPPAGPHDKYIEPGQSAPKLRTGDKVLLGLKDAVSVDSVIGWVLSAGYSQVVNNAPNYDQDFKGFSQRLGASAARAFSEGVIGDSVIAPIVHQDPRYYKAGPDHNFFYRATYAASRAFITRTDGGHNTFNIHGLGGDAAGSALTNLYYPSINRSFSQTAQTFGGSVGGDILGYLASEFLPGILSNMHITHDNK